MSKPVTHKALGSWLPEHTVCGQYKVAKMTKEPNKVTCKRCKELRS